MPAFLTRRSRVLTSLVTGVAALTLTATAAGAAVAAPPSLGLPGAQTDGTSLVLDAQGALPTCNADGTASISSADHPFRVDADPGSPYAGTATVQETATYDATSVSAFRGTAHIDGVGATVDATFGATSLLYDPHWSTWTGPLPTASASARPADCGIFDLTVPYTATITLTTGERFVDAGWVYAYGGFGQTRIEFWSAASTVTTPAPPALPTSKAQCMNGGWKSFPGFKNQGDCVSYVATGGKK